MATNVGYEYVRAEEEYVKATTIAAKIAALQKMRTTVPKHKGTEKMQLQIKKRLAELKQESKKEKRAGKGTSLGIKKEGAAQVVLIGLPNSGKSTVLQELSGEKVEIAEYPFTTKKPEMRMIPYENIWLQGIEIPAAYEGFSGAPASRQLLGLIKTSDYVILVIDGTDAENQIKIILSELEKAKIHVCNKKKFENFVYQIPAIIVYTRQLARLKTELKQFFYLDKEKIAATIWAGINKIRVQTRTHGKTAGKPVILDKGATVKDLAGAIHKDFVQKFKHAKVWGPSASFPAQQVGFEHVLKDKDIVEIYLK